VHRGFARAVVDLKVLPFDNHGGTIPDDAYAQCLKTFEVARNPAQTKNFAAPTAHGRGNSASPPMRDGLVSRQTQIPSDTIDSDTVTASSFE